MLDNENLKKNIDIITQLEEISEGINAVVNGEDDITENIRQAWVHSNSIKLSDKYKAFVSDLKKIDMGINEQIENVKKISRLMYLIQQEYNDDKD